MFLQIFMAENWSYTFETKFVWMRRILLSSLFGMMAMQSSLKLGKYGKPNGHLWFHHILNVILKS